MDLRIYVIMITKKKNKSEALTLRLAGVGVKCSKYIFTGLFELSPLVRR